MFILLEKSIELNINKYFKRLLLDENFNSKILGLVFKIMIQYIY